ncbi:MAG: hypothetical protein ACPGNT_10160, partial [Rhodospirillales bacterium]
PPSLLADVFESLVAAMYLDGGDAAARDFIQRFVGPEVELAAAGDLPEETVDRRLADARRHVGERG